MAMKTIDELDREETVRRMTNVEFVTHMMEYSKHGALMQAFILEACRKYADACAKADASVFDSALLNGKAWKGCAVELQAALIARHGS
jgi:hypothetical protein